MAGNKLIVVAIDFGTTFSGWAFSVYHEYKSDPTKVSTKHWHSGGAGALVSEKAPTCLLIKPDGITLQAFGYDAENQYIKLAENDNHKDYYYFRRFKMILNRKLDEGLSRTILLEDDSGKELEAKVVFSLAIRYLKDDVLGVCKTRGGFKESDVQWVLTVPAIWSDAAKQFMREVAIDAGIDSDSLKIALEPEAASIFCRHLPVERKSKGSTGSADIASFSPGTKYMILDAGGGTVDITIHEVKSDGGLKEIHRATGGGWGGTLVDEQFKQMLIRIIGNPVYMKFKKVNTDDWLEMFRDFEIKKRNVTPTGNDKVTFRIPLALMELFQEKTGETFKETIQQTRYAGKISLVGDKLRCEASVMRELFEQPVDCTIRHVQTLMREPVVRGISAILMVGGFSESKILQDAVRRAFPLLKLIIPPEAGLCVLKGAVIFGHNPAAVDERILKFTYGFHIHRDFIKEQDPQSQKEIIEGVEKCMKVFDKHVEINATVKLGDAQIKKTYIPKTSQSTSMRLSLYGSENRNPRYITDMGTIEVGELTVDLPDTTGGKDRPVLVNLIFGDTEIHVQAREEKTGKLTTASFDFLK